MPENILVRKETWKRSFDGQGNNTVFIGSKQDIETDTGLKKKQQQINRDSLSWMWVKNLRTC